MSLVSIAFLILLSDLLSQSLYRFVLMSQRSSDLANIGISFLRGLAFSDNDEGVQALHSALPLIEKADLLVQVGFQCVDDLDILLDGLAVRVSNNRDQEVGKDQENEEQVQVPNPPDQEDHEVGVQTVGPFLLLSTQILAPPRVVWHCDVGQGVTPCLKQNGDELMEVGVVSQRVAGSNSLQLTGENEDPEEHEGKENLDIRKRGADQRLEEAELLEHLEVEQELLGCVHDQREAQESERVLNPVLLVIWHLQRWILDAQRKVERIREEAHQVNPVHETGKICASLQPQLLDLESHEQKGGQHADGVAREDDRRDEDVHLDEEGDEEADGVADEHVLVDLLGVCVLEVDDVTNRFLLPDVAVGLLYDIKDEVRQVEAGHREVGLQSWVVAATHDLSVLVDVVLDVLDLALEEEESQVQEEALDLMFPAVGQSLLLHVLIDGVAGILAELVVRVRVWEGKERHTERGWQARDRDLLREVQRLGLGLPGRRIDDAFLREEVVKVGLLSVGTLEHVAEHRHQVLLCLHVMSHVTVICL